MRLLKNSYIWKIIMYPPLWKTFIWLKRGLYCQEEKYWLPFLWDGRCLFHLLFCLNPSKCLHTYKVLASNFQKVIISQIGQPSSLYQWILSSNLMIWDVRVFTRPDEQYPCNWDSYASTVLTLISSAVIYVHHSFKFCLLRFE